jgi:DnaJ-class molecular chaperone
MKRACPRCGKEHDCRPEPCRRCGGYGLVDMNVPPTTDASSGPRVCAHCKGTGYEPASGMLAAYPLGAWWYTGNLIVE